MFDKNTPLWWKVAVVLWVGAMVAVTVYSVVWE
jgi:hypothetical protein